jgi:hypothetical protein
MWSGPLSEAWFHVSSIELHVLDGERVLGSSEDGPIFATAGEAQFEFVNSAIGYRVRRVVNIRPGQIGSLSVTPPTASSTSTPCPGLQCGLTATRLATRQSESFGPAWRARDRIPTSSTW